MFSERLYNPKAYDRNLRLPCRFPRWNEVARMDEQIARIEQRLRMWLKQDRDCSAIAEIPGVGLLTTTAAVATMADPKSFRSGREFAAFIGLVPRQHGSGGKLNLFGISKRGDTYLVEPE
ncbi:transposase [Paraburkholderia youngii]